MKPDPIYIGGEWRTTSSVVEQRSPVNGSVLGAQCLAGVSDLADAVLRAREGFEETKKLPSYRRAEVLFAIADGLENQKSALAECITGEIGKAIQFSRAEVERAIMTFRLAGEEAKRIVGEVLPLDLNEASLQRYGVVRRFPIGIVLAICPFNYPLNLAAHKIAPAIAAGNAILFKPAPQAPRTALELTRIIAASGFPARAFSFVPTSNEAAETLVTDDRIAMVSFTGSASVGWKLKSLAGKKKVLLELGGNAGVIVDDSANLADAVKKNVTGSFVYSGQVCIKVQRIFVHDSVYEEYSSKFVAAARGLKVGDPFGNDTVVGPLIDDTAAARVEAWIQEAVRSGSKILTGGARRERVIEPTVLTEADRTAKVSCQEIFGPVVTLSSFKTFDEAINLVNDTRYGLQAGVFSNNYRNILRAYEGIHAGAVVVNDNPTYRVDHMPYGGIKDSGFGREGLKYAIEAMTEPKLLVMNPS